MPFMSGFSQCWNQASELCFWVQLNSIQFIVMPHLDFIHQLIDIWIASNKCYFCNHKKKLFCLSSQISLPIRQEEIHILVPSSFIPQRQISYFLNAKLHSLFFWLGFFEILNISVLKSMVNLWWYFLLLSNRQKPMLTHHNYNVPLRKNNAN